MRFISRLNKIEFCDRIVNKNQQVFFELVRAGLWKKGVQIAPYGDVDFAELFHRAEDQSVVGLVAAGIEYILDKKLQKKDVLQFIGQTVQLEQRNRSMNCFIGVLTEKMRDVGISFVLVKGQGIAQCYERPLWRASGDVDLLLDRENYEKAKKYLCPLAVKVDAEDKSRLHLGLTIEPWLVELHGTLHSNHYAQMDRLLDEVQNEMFQFGYVRIWKNDTVDVFLPSANEDVIFVFAHILQHFFGGGIGLRQLCDWCRLMWAYRSTIDWKLLETRIRRMGMMPKWRAFAALAVDSLGMPIEAMPLYSNDKRWKKKADRILSLIMESGNLGHGRDVSYKENHSAFVANFISFWVYTRYNIIQFSIFPWDAIKGWRSTISKGIKAAIKRKTDH